jgi:hypothetical protein
MNKEEVKSLVEEYAPGFIWGFQLQDWEVTFEYGTPPGEKSKDVKGWVRADPKYKRALIILNYDTIEDADDAIYTIRHELLHILHSAIELYREGVSEAIKDETIFSVVDVNYQFAAEDIVNHLERMLDLGLGLPGGKVKNLVMRLTKKHYERHGQRSRKKTH